MSSHAVDCALAGIRAVDPTLVTRQAVQHVVQDTALLGPVTLVAIGKAAAAMAAGALEVVAAQVTHGVIVAPVPVPSPSSQIAVFTGGHPVPNEDGMYGAEAIEALARALHAGDTLLCLISGGASALTMLPAEGISLQDAQSVTTLLLRAGATIDELNCVRKHIDRLKGGRLARLAAPARVVTLILSDVIGDPLTVIASGPTVPDPTTVGDAVAILRTRHVWGQLPASVRTHLERGADESPKSGDPCFARVTSSIIANNTIAADAAKQHAESLGYVASVQTVAMHGEAREVGEQIARDALAFQQREPGVRACFVYAGEPTVTVTGSGQGGRNQELALAAAIALDGQQGITVTSIGTDGIDGPTDAAGAVASGETLARARERGVDANAALADNDAYAFWRTVEGLVITGPTGTNVMDLVVVTVEARAAY